MVIAMFLVLVTSAAAQSVERAALIIPPLDNWVVDTTHTFDAAQKKALAQRLEAFEKSKGAQIFVLMIPSTAPEDIEQYTRRAFDQWKIGRKNIDDGVLLVVAKEDRRLRIEVGYGLEGAITDLQAGRIIREFITPYFMHDDYVSGINSGVNQLIALVDGEELPPPSSAQYVDTEEDAPLAVLLPLAFFALVLPPLAAAVIIGLFSFFLFWSLPAAIAFGIGAFVLSLIGKAFGAGGRGNSAQASRRGSHIGGLGGGFGRGGGGGGGMGGGGGGGGGASGGGGGSGGGGASGGW